MQRKIVNQYYILSCLFNMGSYHIISATYVSFLLHNKLSLLEVNLVNTVFFFTTFILEIPTGAFADIFGRKRSFVLACLIKGLGMFVYSFSHSFIGFIVAEMIAAIGKTFYSGAFEAWMVDSLKHHGYEGELSTILARENLLQQVSGGIAAVAGAYIAFYYPSLPWFIGGMIMAITMFMAQRMMCEEYFVKKPFSWKKGFDSMKEVAVSSIKYGIDHKAVRFIIIITGIQVFSVQALNMYWQPFFKGYGIEEKYFGFLLVGIQIALGCGALIASKCRDIHKERNLILISYLWTGILIITTVLIPQSAWVIVPFLLHEIPRGLWKPLLGSYLHTRIPSSERATISSFCSIAPHLGGAIGLVVSGFIAQYWSISTAWIISGILLVVGTLIVGRNGHNGSE